MRDRHKVNYLDCKRRSKVTDTYKMSGELRVGSEEFFMNNKKRCIDAQDAFLLSRYLAQKSSCSIQREI